MTIFLLMAVVLLSGCTSNDILPEGLPAPSIPSLDEISKMLPKLPFFGGEENITDNKSLSEFESTIRGDKKVNESITSKDDENLSQVVSEIKEVSEINVKPVFAQLNTSSGLWDVVFEIEFRTNIAEESGEWTITLLKSGDVVKRAKAYTSGTDDGFEGFEIKFSLSKVKEDSKYTLKIEKDVDVLQKGGSTVASYRIEKEMELSLSPSLEIADTNISCGVVEISVNHSGLLPAKINIDISFTGGEMFTKSFMVTGGGIYRVDFDSNLRSNIFDVKNGGSTIILNLEKYIRIASTPGKNASIKISSGNSIYELKLAAPNITVEREDGKLILMNGNENLPIYIDSVIEVGQKTIPVGILLCDKMEIKSSFNGRIIVVGGPNLFWDDYKERYLTKKPEIILFDGEI